MEKEDIRDISAIIGAIKVLALLGQTERIVEVCDEWANKFSNVVETKVEGE